LSMIFSHSPYPCFEDTFVERGQTWGFILWNGWMNAYFQCRSIARGYGVCDNPPRKIPYYRLRPIHFGH
jgi:hypothetical protein